MLIFCSNSSDFRSISEASSGYKNCNSSVRGWRMKRVMVRGESEIDQYIFSNLDRCAWIDQYR